MVQAIKFLILARKGSQVLGARITLGNLLSLSGHAVVHYVQLHITSSPRYNASPPKGVAGRGANQPRSHPASLMHGDFTIKFLGSKEKRSCLSNGPKKKRIRKCNFNFGFCNLRTKPLLSPLPSFTCQCTSYSPSAHRYLATLFATRIPLSGVTLIRRNQINSSSSVNQHPPAATSLSFLIPGAHGRHR